MSRRFLGLWTAAVLAAAAAFCVQLTVRFETIRLAYEVGEARKERDRLLDEKRMLDIESESLRQPARVETIARGKLGMDTLPKERVVSMRRPVRSGARGSVRP